MLVSLLAAFLLVSCQSQETNITNDNTSDTNSATDEISAEPSARQTLTLLEGGEFKFDIIRPERTEDSIISAATYLRDTLKKKTGADITLRDDFLKKGTEHDPNTYEILVGYTNYPESAKLHEGLYYGQYRIAIDGNKIVIAAFDGNALKKAASAFAFHVEDLITDGKALIDSSYNAQATVDSTLSLVPAFDFGTYFACYTGSYQDKNFVYKGTTPEDFNAYIDKAKSAGCELAGSHELGSNLSATLTHDNAVINMFYNAADSKTRIIVENSRDTAYPLNESDNQYEKICSSVLVQLGLEPTDSNYFTTSAPNYSNGMGYIYRLHDGSFIIIDGGFNTADNATLIYDTLCELAPDKNNIVIAAWIITHQHADHIGAMDIFTSMYASKVKLELAIYNFPTTAECGTIINGNPYNADRFYQYIKNYPGVKSVIAHPGQYYNIRNAKIEMLHTLDLMRGDVTMEDSNSVCLAFRVEIEGQTFLFPADSYQDMTAVLVKNYGAYLKSDFCQLIHHGGTGGSNAFYKAVDPTIVLWPVGAWYYYPTFRYHDFNKYIFESANVKEIILAASANRTIELPYAYPTERILPPEIPITWK